MRTNAAVMQTDPAHRQLPGAGSLYSPVLYTLYGCHDLSSRSRADHRVQDFGAERKVYVWNARVGVERMTLGTSCAS